MLFLLSKLVELYLFADFQDNLSFSVLYAQTIFWYSKTLYKLGDCQRSLQLRRAELHYVAFDDNAVEKLPATWPIVLLSHCHPLCFGATKRRKNLQLHSCCMHTF